MSTRNLIETLEARQMMSANPMALTITSATVNGGLQLRVNGTVNADNINVSLAKGGLLVTNGSFAQTVKGNFKSILVNGGEGNDKITIAANVTLSAILFGGAGNDSLTGGAGADKLYGQSGDNVLNGGAGDDVLVTIGGGTADKSTGGTGFDSFWSDSAVTEKVTDLTKGELLGGASHRVSGFFGASVDNVGNVKGVRSDLDGGNLADPTVDDGSTYSNFSANPLFSTNGPTADDIVQGYVGDCWFLSTLASIAKTNPTAIRQMVTELGDGTYAVQFHNADGSSAFVRVDGDLAKNQWGDLEYAGLGKQNSMWVAIVEKAFASFRQAGQSDYATLDGGWMDEAFTDLGFSSNQIWNVKNGNDLLTQIAAQLKAGKAVTMAINEPTAGASLIGSHAYTVVSVGTDSKGNKTLTLRNPWGIDGAGHDGKDDGYVTITAAQAFGSFWGVIAANVG